MSRAPCHPHPAQAGDLPTSAASSPSAVSDNQISARPGRSRGVRGLRADEDESRLTHPNYPSFDGRKIVRYPQEVRYENGRVDRRVCVLLVCAARPEIREPWVPVAAFLDRPVELRTHDEWDLELERRQLQTTSDVCERFDAGSPRDLPDHELQIVDDDQSVVEVLERVARCDDPASPWAVWSSERSGSADRRHPTENSPDSSPRAALRRSAIVRRSGSGRPSS